MKRRDFVKGTIAVVGLAAVPAAAYTTPVFASGGPIKAGLPYLVGEQASQQIVLHGVDETGAIVKESITLSSTTPTLLKNKYTSFVIKTN